jgi:anti-anti-sigma factor
MLEIELDRGTGDFSICRPVGELDASTVCQFRQVLAELTTSPRLLIDLSCVCFIDSAGLGALIGGIRRAREWGGDVVLSCSRPALTRLLRTTGLDRIVCVEESVERAVAAFAPDGPGAYGLGPLSAVATVAPVPPSAPAVRLAPAGPAR